MIRLVAITDGLRGGLVDLVDRAAAAVSGGATSVQVRLKGESARVIADVTRAIVARVGAQVPVLVNDRFDVALAAGAAGVHLGADDVAVRDARHHVPPGFIIGTSVGCGAEVANAALADYVGIGPVYATGTKGDAGAAIGTAELARLAAAAGKPAVGVGGITAENAAAVIAAGAAGVAVVSAIFDPRFSAADVAEAARALSRATGR